MLNLGIVLTLIIGCSEASLDENYQEALRAINQDDYGKAIILLKQNIQSAPNDANSRLLLAKGLVATGAYQSALKEIRFIESDSGSSSQLKAIELDALYKLREYDEIIAHISPNKVINNEHAKLYIALALLAERDKRGINALEELTKADNVKVSELANAYKQLSTGKLEEVLNSGLADKDVSYSNSEFNRLKVKVLSKLGRHGDSAEMLRKIIRLAPRDNILKMELAIELLRNKQFEEANAVLDPLLTNNQNQPFLNRLKGYALDGAGEHEEALYRLEKSNVLGLRTDNFLLDLALIANKLDLTEKSYDYISSIKKPETLGTKFEDLNFLLSLKLGYIDKVMMPKSSLADVPSKYRSATGLALVADGELQRAENMFNLAASDSENLDKVSFGVLGAALGKTRGVDALVQLVEESPTENNAELLAAGLLQTENFDDALAYAAGWIKTDNLKSLGLLLKANVSLRNNKPSEAITYAEEILSFDKDNIRAKHFIAGVAAEMGDRDKALLIYSELLRNDKTNSLYAYQAYRNSERGSGQDFKDALENQVRLNGNSANTLYLSKIYLAESEPRTAFETLNQFKNKGWFTNDHWSYLVAATFASGTLSEANKLSKQWMLKAPKDFEAFAFHVGVLEIEGKFEEALKLLAQKEGLFSKIPSFVAVKANFLLLSGNLSEAYEALESLPDNNKKGAVYSNLMGRYNLANQNYAVAAAFLGKAYEEQPSFKYMMYYLNALKRQNKAKEIATTLEDYVTKKPQDNKGWLQYAIYYNEISPKKSASAYRKILQNEPKHFIALNNLAMTLLELGELSHAQQIVDRGLVDYQNNPSFIDTASRVLFANGDTDTANELYEDYIKKYNNGVPTELYKKYLASTVNK